MSGHIIEIAGHAWWGIVVMVFLTRIFISVKGERSAEEHGPRRGHLTPHDLQGLRADVEISDNIVLGEN